MADQAFCPSSSSSFQSSWSSATCEGSSGGIGGTLISALLTTLVDAGHLLGDVSRYPPDVQPNESYDFLVVGGGSAGAVVAARLSENPKWNVLLLEAGGDPPLTAEIPPLFHTLQGTDIDWAFRTEPQEHACLGMLERRCFWPRGKVLGGSGVLNSMLHVRGNKRDFDNWAAHGNIGWSYEDVLPYFKKLENMKRPQLSKQKDEEYSEFYHSVGGPITLDLSDYRSPIVDALIQSAKEMGYRVGDINGGNQTGFTLQHAAIVNGTRCSSAKGYLIPARNRPNLHVTKHTHVTKILIEENTRKVFGVEFEKNGKLQTVRANKEVILSAGSVGSPQLLMLSGIGPKEHLQNFSIHVVEDLPVGENLQDHMELLTPTFIFNKTNPYKRNHLKELEDTFEYLIHRRGPLAGLNMLHFQGFIHTKYSDPLEDFPDIQYQHILFAFNDTEWTQRVSHVTGYTDEVYRAVFGIPNAKGEIYMPLAVLQRPKSRGSIKLKSADAMDAPIIDPRYLSHPDDVRTLVEGIMFALRMSQSTALKPFEVEPSKEPVPACANHLWGSDAYWACAVRHLATTIYHPVGTCKMGPTFNREAVVDPRLKVYGVKGLRVIDASIMPYIVTGNINAAVVMIAEKGADLLKEDWLGK